MKMTLYKVLGVEADADADAISAAFMQRQALFDSGNCDRNEWVLAREAYAVLSNPDKRAMYDASQRPAPMLAQPPAPGEAAESMHIDWRLAAGLGLAAVLAAAWWFKRPEPQPAAVKLAYPRIPAQGQVRQIQAPVPVLSSVELSSEDLFARLAPSIARINVRDHDGRNIAVGSGVVIEKGAVITNCHVALAGPRLFVTLQGRVHEARVGVSDKAHDLCSLDLPIATATPVAIGSSDDVRTGQKVIAIGAPHGLDLTISEGIVSSVRRLHVGGKVIQTTAPVSPGSSGGGLFDTRGTLVGIVTFQLSQGQNLNFAAPAEWIGSMRNTTGSLLPDGYTPNERGDPGAVDARVASPASQVAGGWSCRDAVGGKTARVDFLPNGRVNMLMGSSQTPAAWYLMDGRLGIVMSRGTQASVEEFSAQKIILGFGAGYRTVCERE